MNPDWTVFSAKCPSRLSLARIANKWTAMILILLDEQPQRFCELASGVDGISNKVLVDTLRALERDGLITKAEHPDGHGRYDLTSLGRTLHDPLLALQVWAESHVEEVLESQDRYDSAAAARVLSMSGYDAHQG